MPKWGPERQRAAEGRDRIDNSRKSRVSRGSGCWMNPFIITNPGRSVNPLPLSDSSCRACGVVRGGDECIRCKPRKPCPRHVVRIDPLFGLFSSGGSRIIGLQNWCGGNLSVPMLQCADDTVMMMMRMILLRKIVKVRLGAVVLSCRYKERMGLVQYNTTQGEAYQWMLVRLPRTGLQLTQCLADLHMLIRSCTSKFKSSFAETLQLCNFSIKGHSVDALFMHRCSTNFST